MCAEKCNVNVLAWSKRWFSISKGILQYYKNPTSYSRASVDVSTATIVVVVKAKLINIDSGTTLLHLKAMRQQDFDTWVAELRKFQHVEVSMNIKGSSSNPDLLSGDSDDDDEGDDAVNADTSTPQGRLHKVKKDLEALHILAKPYLPDTPKVHSPGAPGTPDTKLSVRNIMRIGKKTSIGESHLHLVPPFLPVR